MSNVEHGFDAPDEDTREICKCGAAFVEGFHLNVMKRAHLEVVL